MNDNSDVVSGDKLVPDVLIAYRKHEVEDYGRLEVHKRPLIPINKPVV